MCDIIYIFKIKNPILIYNLKTTVTVIKEKISFVRKNQLKIHCFSHWIEKVPCKYTI